MDRKAGVYRRIPAIRFCACTTCFIDCETADYIDRVRILKRRPSQPQRLIEAQTS